MDIFNIFLHLPLVTRRKTTLFIKFIMGKQSIKFSFLFIFIYTLSYTSTYAQKNSIWKPVYPPFDSIAYKMENLNERDPELVQLLSDLYKISEDTNIPILKYRCYYWDALIQRKIANRIDSTCMQNLKNAIIYMDTSEYFFDWNEGRILQGS